MARAQRRISIGRLWSVASVAAVLIGGVAGSATLASVPAGATPRAPTSVAAAQTSTVSDPGYWLASSAGGIYQFNTTNFGALSNVKLREPIVGGAATDDGLGYWLTASDGGIFSFGDAGFAGSAGSIALRKPVVGMAANPAAGGQYWQVASDGGIFSYGGAPFWGSTGNVALHKPIVAMTPTSDGKGYWLVASDGGVFAFGDAGFYGSTGNIALHQPVVGMAATPDGKGYWLVASDGGIFAFGDAGFYGSTGGIHLNKPVVGMAASPDGAGYWLVGADGGVFDYGDAPFLGSAKVSDPVVAILATNYGYPFPPGATGNDISWPQCNGSTASVPGGSGEVRIVGVTDGALASTTANPCLAQEAAWAGTNASAYIVAGPLNQTDPNAEAAACAGSQTCEAYDFGYNYAKSWVATSEAAGFDPSLWWVDVELDEGWSTNASLQPINTQVISGEIAGLEAAGRLAGIYATEYQWNQITGSTASYPGIPLWVPGAGPITGGSSSATSICSDTAGSDYLPFADGNIVLVQYGYGSSPTYDEDYACP